MVLNLVPPRSDGTPCLDAAGVRGRAYRPYLLHRQPRLPYEMASGIARGVDL